MAIGSGITAGIFFTNKSNPNPTPPEEKLEFNTKDEYVSYLKEHAVNAKEDYVFEDEYNEANYEFIKQNLNFQLILNSLIFFGYCTILMLNQEAHSEIDTNSVDNASIAMYFPNLEITINGFVFYTSQLSIYSFDGEQQSTFFTSRGMGIGKMVSGIGREAEIKSIDINTTRSGGFEIVVSDYD
jgi:hypothetical protein